MKKILILLTLIGAFNLNSGTGTSKVLEDKASKLVTIIQYFRYKLNKKQLFKAIDAANIDKVKKLLKASAYLDASDKKNDTPLHRAAKSGDPKITQLLIDAGVNLNAKNIVNYTPLHWAALQGTIEIARILINAGADVDVEGSIYFNNTPLYYAIRNHHYDISRLLIEKGANVNICSGQYKRTPLHNSVIQAIYSNNSMVKPLINVGSDINIQDSVGNTPINLAQGEIKQLLQNIVNVEQQLENLTPEDSIESILDQYDQDFKSTIIKRLFFKKDKFSLLAQALKSYPWFIDSRIRLNIPFIRILKQNNFNNLKNLIEFIVNKNSLNLLNEDNAAIIEFINKWSQETLNPDTSRAILLGEIPEDANEIEYRVYKIARTNNYRRLGRLIRDWAEKTCVLDGDVVLHSDIASKISGY